jgi:hypothetical protein
MFSGGDFHEVARWLQNFVVSHAKRESPRIEAVVEADEAHPTTYGVRLRLGERWSPRIELDFKTVADNRGSLAWCSDLAAQVRSRARDLLAASPSATP